ncbi:SRPBCC family protein [Phaeocystidibacter marisrubri]|uniref:SRPBCC domain-containing protein n=1 Tax=Phaeocystidibacter marisrubri TaxID=1577780 RepID=A0A6L3ZER6_9FLAO|nr:SRPBCC domain-containing protein [Phaeocystidibacter marisrubri]KAB2815892.1 SRPBCC domain-containing protein [Phaeocystidibacter marisrubri]GGH66259.1 hypothetical protein GCM10011318_04030 [Phaeocystidibacter marisrubri]
MSKTVFIEDLENATLTITRSFRAPLTKVWDAFTQPEILDQWWAPKPWKAKTHEMKFENGGYWKYSMNGPEGERHACRMNYGEIVLHEKYTGADYFCDDHFEIKDDMPSSNNVVTFMEIDGHCEVVMVSDFGTVEALQQVIKMGMKEGLTMAQDQLEALLEEGRI